MLKSYFVERQFRNLKMTIQISTPLSSGNFRAIVMLFGFKTSLVVQWVRLYGLNVGIRVQSLVKELEPTGCN